MPNNVQDEKMRALIALDETVLKKLTDCDAAGSDFKKTLRVLAHTMIEFGAHHTDGATHIYLPEILEGLANKLGWRYRPAPDLPPCAIEIQATIPGNANQRAEIFLRAFADTLASNVEMEGNTDE